MSAPSKKQLECSGAHVSLCGPAQHPLANITALVKVTMWFITNVKSSIILDCLLTTLPDSLSIGQPLQPSPEPFSACLQFSPCFGLIFRCHCPCCGWRVGRGRRREARCCCKARRRTRCRSANCSGPSSPPANCSGSPPALTGLGSWFELSWPQIDNYPTS